MRTIKSLALVPVVMAAMAMTFSEAAAQQGGGAHGRMRATARVIQLLVPPARLATVIAEMVSDSIPKRRVLPCGVYLTVIEAPAATSRPQRRTLSPAAQWVAPLQVGSPSSLS